MSKHVKRTAIVFSVIFLVFFIVTFLAYLLSARQTESTPAVSHGELNITAWDYKDGIIPLNGEWNFYWNKLVGNDDITKGITKPDLITNVPNVWNTYRIGGKSLPGFGYATYALRVTGAEKGRPLSLWIPTFSTAYRLYVDGHLLAKNGTISARSAEGVAEYWPQFASFTPSSDEFTIVIQTSNYAYARGGMWYTLYMGAPDQISSLPNQLGRRDFFLIGSILMMGFVFLMAFLFRRQEKANLYFSLLCLLAFFRVLIYGSYSINLLLPINNFSLMVHIDYIIVVCFPGIMALLIFALFPDEISETVAKIIAVYGGVASVVILLTPICFFTGMVYFFQAADILLVLYLFICLTKAIVRGKPDAPLVFSGLLAIMIGFVRDLMFQNNYISGGLFEWSPIGFFVMLALESIVLARRFACSVNDNEKAVAEIRALSIRERNTELKFLKAQIRPHFLYNCLNTIISVSRTDMNSARKLLIEFSNYLRGCFDFNNLEDKVPIESELKFIRSFIILEQARFGEKLRVTYDIDETGLMVPPLILQPLVENAIVHGIRPKPDGGTVLIYVKQNGGFLRLGVRDDGCGIPKEKAASILSGQEQGAGIGIYNINQRLNSIYGTSLQIKNIDGGGTDIYMELNMEGPEHDDQSHTD